MKQERTDYADGKRRARGSDLEPGDLVLSRKTEEREQALNHLWGTSIYH